MDPEATLVDRDTRPDPRHQIMLADNLARMLDQNEEDIERAAADMKRDTFPFDQPLRCVQAERSERNDFVRPRSFLDALAHFRIIMQGRAGSSRRQPLTSVATAAGRIMQTIRLRAASAQDQPSFDHCDVCFLSAATSCAVM
jgi:hypothetical protein